MGYYKRKLQTRAGEVKLKMPKLRRQTFETAIIERYRRRESSVCKAPEFLDTELHKIHAASAMAVWAARTWAGVA